MSGRWRRAVRAVALALALTGAGGCAETPAQGFEAFYAALVAGDAAALERLDDASRARVVAAAQARALDPVRLLAGSGVRSTLRAIRQHERDDERATLEVEDALGATERVTMVKERGRWCVNLAEAAAPEGAP
ncbi:MAG: hypothetical protein IT383_15575 [Deltaproteobacteria bacterium]|nr:hypothetical protein [Deltaproteobacteria bacterium]